MTFHCSCWETDYQDLGFRFMKGPLYIKGYIFWDVWYQLNIPILFVRNVQIRFWPEVSLTNAHICSNNKYFLLIDRSWHLQMDGEQWKLDQNLKRWIATSNIFQKINYTLPQIKYRLTFLRFEDSLSNQRSEQISFFKGQT